MHVCMQRVYGFEVFFVNASAQGVIIYILQECLVLVLKRSFGRRKLSHQQINKQTNT